MEIARVLGIDLLRRYTDDFFALHWQEHSSGPRAHWADPFAAASSGPYPNHNLQGCYALFHGAELRYIGVAASRGAGRYKGHGIGARLKHVVAVDWKTKTPEGKRVYRVLDRWSDITHISTIGFPVGYGYLAAALECYLLTRPGTEALHNKNRPGAA